MYKRLPVTNKSRFNIRFAIVKTANEKKIGGGGAPGFNPMLKPCKYWTYEITFLKFRITLE